MNCTQALERLLDADLDAPSTEQDRALGTHLAECGRCARAAAALKSGTMAFSQAVAGTRVIAARPKVAAPGLGWWAPRFAFGGAALAVVGVVVSRMIITEPAMSTSTSTAAATSASPPAATVQRATNGVATVPRVVPGAPSASARLALAGPEPERIEPERVDPLFFTSEPVKVVAVEATPFVLTNAADVLPVTPENRAESARLPDITVTNRLGTHAMVSRTADPNIVVVWLSAEPNRRNP